MAIEDWQVPLWDAINRYVVACGGDPSKHVYGNTSRMKAVGDVNEIVREVESIRFQEARGCIKLMLRSALPRAKEHPTMWDAWGDASAWLGEDRNAHRV